MRQRAEQIKADIDAGHIVGMLGATIWENGEVRFSMAGVAADSPALSATIAARLKAKIDALLLM